MFEHSALCLIALVAARTLSIVSEATSSKSFTPIVDPYNNVAALCAIDPPTAVLPLADVSVGIPDEVPRSVICSYGCAGFLGCLCFNYRQQQRSAPAQCEIYNYIPRNCTTDTAGLCQHYEMTGQSISSCSPTVSGGWSEWITTTPCSGIGQKYYVQTRNCNKPAPSNGGSACKDTNGSLALIETRQLLCECDSHCNSSQCTKGYLQCDTSCGVGYGINSTSFVCKACNSSNCNSSCNDYGPGTCDGPCKPGYYLNTTTHKCIVYRQRDIGCYADKWDRDLTPEIWSNQNMTPSYCANSCQSKNYAFAAVQAGSYCLCGNTYGRYGPATNCNLKCSGDSSQTCGGVWANFVMQCGCDPNCNSIEDCAINGAGKCDTVCKLGWTMTSDHSCKRCDPNCDTTACTTFQCSSCVAGYGISKNPEVCLQCKTPNCLGSCNKYGPGTCDGPCRTGYELHATLHTCLLFPYRSLGCYADKDPRDIGPFTWNDHSAMTLSACMQSCHNNGYRYAGAQYGAECYCGNSYGSYGSSTTCNTACSGNSSQICGAFFGNTVMDFACDPNCAEPNDCLLYGVFKCDTRCKPGYNMTSRHTCKGCPNGYTFLAGQDNCYMVSSSLLTARTNAAKTCENINNADATYDVHLAYIETAEEQTAVFNFIGVIKPVWTGGCRTANNDFVWARSCSTSNGPAFGIQTEKMNYTMWSTGQPDNVFGREWCVIMLSNGAWSDENCDSLTYQSVCEIEN